MATTQTQSNVNISDIPEELKPFRQAGLESLMSLVFAPQYIQELKNRGIFPAGTNPVAPPTGGGGSGNNGGNGTDGKYPGDPGYNATSTGKNQASNALLSDNNIMALISKLGGYNTDGTIDGVTGSALTNNPLSKKSITMSSQGVNLNGVGLDLNGNPYPVDQKPGGGIGDIITIGKTPTYPQYQGTYRPIVVPTQYPNPTNTGGGNPGTGGGSNPGTGGGNPGNGGGGAPGSGGGSTGPRPHEPMGPGTPYSTGPIGNFNGLPTGSEYNTNQYASDALAQKLATALGANVIHTNTGGPNGPPPQNLLDFNVGGSGNYLNAGLVNQMLTDPGQQPFAAARLRDELAMLSRGPNFDAANMKRGGMVRYARGGTIPYGNGISRYDAGGTIDPNSNYPYAPYTPYQGQRFLDYNTIPGANNIPTSNATRASEQGFSSIPGVFDDAGGINAGRVTDPNDPNYGKATTNFGIANDQMDWAGQKLGDAIEGYGSIANNAQQLSNGFNYNPTLKSAGQISVDPLNQYQIAPSAMWTDPGTAQAYMNPYMDAVTNVQKQRAIDDFGEQRGYRNSQAVAAGAFGGSRQAVQEGLAQRALSRNLQAIDANGLNNAYTQGMGQFNTDRTADYTTNRANLDSALQTQGLATQAGLTAAQANQSTNAQQYGQLLNAQQQAEALRQSALTGAGNLGLQAMQGITGAAGALSSVGATRADLQRLAQQMEESRLTDMAKAGAAQDSRAQQGLDYQYQNFVNQKNWPFQLQNFYTSQLAGQPMGVNQEQVQFQNYSPLSQWGGLISAGIGALGQAGSGGSK